MKKFLFFCILLFSFFLYAEEIKMPYNLKIYFIAENESYIIYDNDNSLFTETICNNLLNAPRFKNSIFDKKVKNNSSYVPGGYFKILLYDENGRRFDYHVVYEDFVYNDTDGKAYKFSFCHELYKYITCSYILNEFIPVERKNYMMRALELKD